MRLIDAEALKEEIDYYIKEANWGDEANKVLNWCKEFIDNAPTVESNRVLYLCDLCGCKGCEEGQNEDNHCQHTSDIAHATNFDALINQSGEVCYVEKTARFKPIAQVNFDDEKLKELSQEAAMRMQDKIERGDLVLKSAVRPVIIHHNGRDFNGYFDSSRMLLFGSYLAAEVANDFGFTWTEVEEEDKNHES